MQATELLAPGPELIAGPVRPRPLTLGSLAWRGPLALVGVTFLYVCWRRGVPIDRDQLFVWSLAFVTAASVFRGPREVPAMLKAWGPVYVALVIFDYSYSLGFRLGVPIHYSPQSAVDRLLGFGQLPTVRLQHSFYNPAVVHWWDALSVIMWLSYFVLPFAAAAVIWIWFRDRFAWFRRAYLSLLIMCEVFYIVFPTAPPWMLGGTSHHPVTRITARAAEQAGISVAPTLFKTGASLADPVASTPSFHAATAFLIALMVIAVFRTPWRWLALVYPLLMSLSLVYLGEHFAVDTILGGGIAVIALGFAHRRELALTTPLQLERTGTPRPPFQLRAARPLHPTPLGASLAAAPKHRPRHRRRPIRTWLTWGTVTAAIALNGFLAMYRLSGRSLWFDEGYTWMTASQSVSHIWADTSHGGGHLLPYYLLVHLSVTLFGDGAVGLRLPSVLAGMGAIPLVYMLARRVGGGRLGGVAAALLMSVSMPLVFWQQNARDYALLVTLAAASTLLFLMTAQTGRTWHAGGWLLVTALACYTHPESILLAGAQLLAAALWPPARELWRRFWPVLLMVALAAAPVAVFAHSDSSAQPGLPEGTRLLEVLGAMASTAGAMPSLSRPDRLLLGITALIWIGAVAHLVADLRRHGRNSASFGPALMLSAFLVPLLAAAAISELGRPVFVDRYLIVCLPAATVVIAITITRLRPVACALHFLVCLMVFHVGVLVPTYGQPVEDFAGASAFVTSHAQIGDCIAFDRNGSRGPYDYYAARSLRRAHPTVSLSQVLPRVPEDYQPKAVEQQVGSIGLFQESQNRTPALVAQTVRSCTRLWYMRADAGSSTGNAQERAQAAATGQLSSQLTEAYQERVVTTFTKVSVDLYAHPRAG
ncbi:MAG: phosphatase PAP2 family protein [Acidimicrobiales bacterium]